jgi:hypothetical protein
MAVRVRRRAKRREASLDVVRVRVLPDGRMDRSNAAKYLGRRPQTLAIWAMNGKGPRPHNVGGRAFYYLDELDAYVAAEGASRSDRPMT